MARVQYVKMLIFTHTCTSNLEREGKILTQNTGILSADTYMFMYVFSGAVKSHDERLTYEV